MRCGKYTPVANGSSLLGWLGETPWDVRFVHIRPGCVQILHDFWATSAYQADVSRDFDCPELTGV